jgi:HEPN domain-containing protein
MGIVSSLPSRGKSPKIPVSAKKRTLPFTHDLIKIGKGLKVGRDLMKSLRELNPEYVISRYPNAASTVPYELYDESRAKRKRAHAEKVVGWTRKRLRL